MSSHLFGRLARLLLLSTIVGAGACVVENASHCGNRDGDATCEVLDPTRPLCNVCVAADDGCTAEIVEESCKPSASDSGVADTTTGLSAASTTAASNSATSSDPSDPDSSDSNPVTLTDPATSEPTTSTDGDSSDSDTPTEPTTGGDTDSSTTDSSASDSDPATSEMTSSDQESSTGEPDCGNGALEPSEECDGVLLNGNTCAELQGFASGQLACNDDCTLDDSGCNACIANLGICSNADDCCSESCVGIVVTGTCAQ